ncbi:hypothetical protein FBEOM_5915 [Fusarium beomiforme]|uniref:Uncharacterized protein n=1 Tax=Fusarium beomiforme TaxID=44412 RepID=A0A9P5AK86_9HYPO|nr:hypothetical protein FBEOM_5915 [Fusarium beomiforme]
MPKRQFIGGPEDDQSKQIVRLGYLPPHQHPVDEETVTSLQRCSVSDPLNDVEAEVSPVGSEEDESDESDAQVPRDWLDYPHNSRKHLEEMDDDSDHQDPFGDLPCWEGPPLKELEESLYDIKRLCEAVELARKANENWQMVFNQQLRENGRLEKKVEALKAELEAIKKAKKESARTWWKSYRLWW